VRSKGAENAGRDPLKAAARKIAASGLAAPAILFLEGVKPLGFVASQFLRFVEPLLAPFSRPGTIDAIASAVGERDGVERFVREIEKLVSKKDKGGGSDRGRNPPPESGRRS